MTRVRSLRLAATLSWMVAGATATMAVRSAAMDRSMLGYFAWAVASGFAFNLGVYGHRRADRQSTIGVTVEERDEPIRAWRSASIVSTPDGYRFNGAYGGLSGVEATARCGAAIGTTAEIIQGLIAHRAPDPGCRCGFYAVKNTVDVPGGDVLLEVELYGRVIEGTLGYRAEKVRVLSARPFNFGGAGKARYPFTASELEKIKADLPTDWAPAPTLHDRSLTLQRTAHYSGDVLVPGLSFFHVRGADLALPDNNPNPKDQP